MKIGVLISGGGSNLQAIIDRCEDKSIEATVAFVGSDRPDVYGLERARKHGIPTFVVDYSRIISAFDQDSEDVTLPHGFDLEQIRSRQTLFGPHTPAAEVDHFLKTRAIAEARLLDHTKVYNPELLVLAGYMRTFSPFFIDRFNQGAALPRIMNIHPALLPAFPGTDGYGDTFHYGCKVGGCTVHFIDYGEDTGPIIGQKAFAITAGDTLETVKEKGLKLEWQLYPKCISLYAQGRLRVVEQTDESGHGGVPARRIVVQDTDKMP